MLLFYYPLATLAPLLTVPPPMPSSYEEAHVAKQTGPFTVRPTVGRL